MAEENINTNNGAEQTGADTTPAQDTAPVQTDSTNSGFKPIQTQEALDAIIKVRLERKEKSVREEFKGYVKPEDYQARLDELTEVKFKLTEIENRSKKTGIAQEFGLPEEMADRLNGNNEKEWRADAEKLSHLFKTPYPRRSTVNTEESGKDADLRSLLNNLRGGN